MSGAVAAHFDKQARACDSMGSPFTATLCRLLIATLDHDTETGRTVLDWPGDPFADALALRLCGGLHALVLDNADTALAACYPPEGNPEKLADILPGAIARHDARLAGGLANAPQTNEIARSAALYPGLLEIARKTRLPLALNEIGASAGLNLLADRFAYRFNTLETGDRDSTVSLAPEMRGDRLPDPRGKLTVASRHGCDIAPLAIADPAARLRLRSYIWPDQPERLRRLDAAIALAGATPFALTAGDAAGFVGDSLANRRLGQAFVLFHSVMWQYLPDSTQNAISDALDRAGNAATRDAPIAWLRMEGLGGVEPHAGLRLTLWPGGETRLLAHCDWHCRWLEWLA